MTNVDPAKQTNKHNFECINTRDTQTSSASLAAVLSLRPNVGRWDLNYKVMRKSLRLLRCIIR